MKLLQTLFWSSRPISWINTAYPFAAGYLIAVQKIDSTLIIGTIFFAIPYNVLMYCINDVFDYQSDLANPRKGGVEGGIIKPALHKPVIITSLLLAAPFLAYLAIASNLAGLAILTASIALVLAYSLPLLRFKERPIIDSLTSSLHFVTPLLFGLSFASFNLQFLPAIAAFLLWGVASHAFGAIQDIQADRQAGISSIATTIGASSTIKLTIFAYAIAAILPLFYGTIAIPISLALSSYILNTIPFRHITDQTAITVNRGWKRFLWLNMLTGFVITITLLFTYVYR